MWKQFWNWVMWKQFWNWKSLEVHARKSLQYHEWTIKGDSGKGPKKNDISRESSNLLREYLSGFKHNVDRNIGDKGHLMRSQMEMNMLLDKGGKVILVISEEEFG